MKERRRVRVVRRESYTARKYARLYYQQLKRDAPGSIISFKDLEQEVYLLSARCRRQYDFTRGHFYPYFIKSIKNEFNRLVKRERKKQVLELNSDEFGGLEALREIVDGEFDISDLAQRKVELADQIGELDGDAKIVFDLLLNLPVELLQTIYDEGRLYGRHVAKYLRKKGHGSKWNEARVSLAKSSIRKVLF